MRGNDAERSEAPPNAGERWNVGMLEGCGAKRSPAKCGGMLEGWKVV